MTGANSGISRAVALGLAQAGADVAVNYVVDPESAEEIAHQIEGFGRRAIALKADVSQEDEVEQMFAKAINHFGTLHISVSNAGLQRDAPFDEMTVEQWNTVIGVNLTGQFLCNRAATREFKRRGLVESVSIAVGKIICMSSMHQEIPWAGHANYAASKGGIMHLLHPTEITDPTWSYIVLGIAFAAEGISWIIALKELLASKNRDRSFWQALRISKDPPVFTVFCEDSAALAGVAVAFLGVYLGHALNNHYVDGSASIVIGLILVAVALFLIYESKHLLVGESADPQIVRHIHEIANADPAVADLRHPLTMHFGPDQVLLNLDIQFRPNISVAELENGVNRLEMKIRQAYPEIARTRHEVAQGCTHGAISPGREC